MNVYLVQHARPRPKTEDPQKNLSDQGLDDATKIAAFLNDRIGDFRCPDHHKAPTVKVMGTSLEEVTFDVTGCCVKCIQMTKEKLSE